MRKKLTIILCIVLTLALCVGVFVGCEQDKPTPTPDPTPTPTPDPTPDPKPDPGEPTLVEFIFTPIVYVGDPYNGETGVGTDTYTAVLKSNVSVTAGTARAYFSIKSLKINGVDATAEELGKMTIVNKNTATVTTEPREQHIKVQFGDFSDPKYYGATFTFEIEADPSSVEAA